MRLPLTPLVWIYTAAGLVLASATLTCGGGESLTAPTAGTVEVTTATTGSNPDADGYTVQIDGGTPQAVAVNGVLRARDVTPGDHMTDLGGVAGNCTVSGENPRAVNVVAGQITPVAFAISCAPATVTPAAIVALSGEGQSAGLGQQLADPLTVSVTDASSNPIEGVTVTWAVTGGGGSVLPASGSTGVQGTASAEWTVGTLPGVQALTASVS